MMSKPPGPTSLRARRFLAVLVVVLAAALLQALGAQAGFARNNLDVDRSDPVIEEQWLPHGPAILELPLDFRAQLEARYTRTLYTSDALTRAHLGQFGPSLGGGQSIQSQLALTRFVSDRIEIGIVWGGRSRLADTDLLNFGRQAVGALIRIVP